MIILLKGDFVSQSLCCVTFLLQIHTDIAQLLWRHLNTQQGEVGVKQTACMKTSIGAYGCHLYWAVRMYRSVCPLVSLYPSVFTLLANYSVLQTQMNINQHHERAEVFPAVIKQWFRVGLVKICRCEFAPAPQQYEHKAPSHLSNLWPPWEMWMIRAQATNRQKNSRNSNKTHWKTQVKFIKQFNRINFCLERGEHLEIYGVFSILVHLGNICSLGLCVLELLN